MYSFKERYKNRLQDEKTGLDAFGRGLINNKMPKDRIFIKQSAIFLNVMTICRPILSVSIAVSPTP